MTELEQAARTAWAAMDPPSKLQRMVDQMAGVYRGPMDPAVALDFVQEHTGGDRDQAVRALMNAGADWLDTPTRPSHDNDLSEACAEEADRATRNLRDGRPDFASTAVSNIEDRCHRHLPGERLAAFDWDRWAGKARHVTDRCEAIQRAAYPKPEREAA